VLPAFAPRPKGALLDEVLMHALKPLAALALAAGLAACGGGSTKSIELDPEGINRPAPTRDPSAPGWLSRMMGADSRPNVGPCPLMGVLYEGSRLVEFSEAGRERYANIAFTGEVQGVRGLCRYVDSDPIRMAIEIDMAFGRGPAATTDRKRYRYWVAVTRRGLAPIEKQYFDIDVEFGGREPVVTRQERIENIVIPRANETVSGENFEILVGFELTPEQLAFNRDGKRFRVDSAANSAS
jgi:hypothetical protein